ncbi:hypothetical protein LYNGBM3L_24590 [Moorena producens 3L]|uniref:Uncharacterized protein n=1 Tax=Moorena producens 3L TaxID=489825 RepID=F4XMB8_9CYAN|nr:hypothetical protein LYNGBM3L_24590 [Moorena producens 3L]
MLVIAILRLVRYKFLVFREQGAGSREQGAGKREEIKNNVYLMSPINVIQRLSVNTHLSPLVLRPWRMPEGL